MAAFKHTCPHCDTKNAGFTVVGDFSIPAKQHTWGISALCNICRQPILVTAKATGLTASSGTKPANINGDIFEMARDSFVLESAWPEASSHDAPPNVPEAIARAFVQASASRKATHYDAACSMYRKSMELGLKAFSPDIEAWKIEKRIDRLATEHRITPELRTWAHELRLDGNDALHGDGEATKEMADQMHELCWFLLTYLYTLPAQVAAAQARRNAE